MGLKLLNFYLGSYFNKILVEECLDWIVESINLVLEKIKGVIVVIENMVG